MTLAVSTLTVGFAGDRDPLQEISAPSVTADEDFTVRWVAVRKEISHGTGHVRMEILDRRVWLGEYSFKIGNITHLESPISADEPASSYDPAKIAATLGKGFRVEKWNHRRVKDAEVFESDWDHGLRFVRLYFVKRDGHFSMSIANFRTAYAESVVIESELLQRKLAGVLDSELPWLDRVYSLLESGMGIGTAEAQSAPGCPPPPNAPPWVLMNCASQQQGQLINQLGAFNNQLAALNQQATAFNQNAAAANANAAAAVKAWNNTNTQLAGFNKNWSESNALLNKALDPTNALFVGLATGAGLAAGGALVSLASTGIVEAAKGIYELITRKGDKAANVAAFAKAMDDYDGVKNSISQWEAKLDSALYLKELATHYKGREVGLLKHFNEVIKRNQIMSAYTDSKALGMLAGHASDACINGLISNGAEFDAIVRQTTKLRDLLEASNPTAENLDSKAGEDGLCKAMKDAIANLMKAEKTLDDAREEITKPNRIADWKEAKETEFRDRMLEKGKKDADANDSFERTKAEYVATYKKDWHIIEQDKYDTILNCAKKKMPLFFGDIPVISLPIIDAAKLRTKCEAELYGPNGPLHDQYEQKKARAIASTREKIESAKSLKDARLQANKDNGPNVWAHTNMLTTMDDKLKQIFEEQRVFIADERMTQLGQKEAEVNRLCRDF